MNLKILSLVKEIYLLGERQFEKEKAARDLILKILSQANLKFVLQKFPVSLPKALDFYLYADQQKIKALPSSFVSGQIKDNETILSSLISSQKFLFDKNINFNPRCLEISLANFYFAPSLAISRQDVLKVSKAKKIKGEVKVQKIIWPSANILVGNLQKPKNILFAHFDSLGGGATDNASGTALLLYLLLVRKELTHENLFVFSGNEELSYDQPIYWGHGYRVFEKKYFLQIKKAKKIFVVDCVGNGWPKLSQDLKFINLGFPIKNISSFKKKIYLLFGDLDRLTYVYHSLADNLAELQEAYLQKSAWLLLEKLK